MEDNSTVTYSEGDYVKDAESALLRLRQDRIVERIRAKDHTVWKPRAEEIANRLGWLDSPAETLKNISYILSVTGSVSKDGFKDVVLLGMGGSSLAAEVFSKMFGSAAGYPALHVLDTTDAFTLARITRNMQPGKTIFLVSSKSGKTIETEFLFRYFFNLSRKESGKAAAGRFIFITDPGSPLEELAYRHAIRHVFLSNPSIGGRYSALSLPGIVPAALIGVNIESLLQKARAAAQREEVASPPGELDSSGITLGVVLGTLAKKGRNKLTFVFPRQWLALGSWLEQLIAESTGKEGKGIVPVVDASLDVPDNYRRDRCFVVYDDGKNEYAGRITALAAAGHPVITIKVRDVYDLGAQMFSWEMATAVAGYILGVNPFDQPDVESAKALTKKMIDLYREKKGLPQEAPDLVAGECRVYGSGKCSSLREAWGNILSQEKEDSYICLQSYLSPTPEIATRLNELRSVLRRKTGMAVMVACGPRYLHSTGQLHKGDAGHGLFVQLTADDENDIAIPDGVDSPDSTLSFAAFKTAQALGDRQALGRLGRKVLRFHLGKEPEIAIEELIKSLN
ncbi:MAG TPA: hypothetical protein PKZ12_00520 [Smithellaceae bacterium]|nr:hypothetical protein [Smithellaceae bacterium]